MTTIQELLRLESEPVIVVDDQGMVERINQAFTREFGWLPEDLAGRPLATIIPPPLRDSHHLGFSRYLATRIPTLLDQPLDLEVATASGKVVMAEHHILAGVRSGAPFFAARLRRRGGGP